MKQYLDLMSHVMANGTSKTDRTGTGTKSVFGYQMRFDLAKGFPCITTKKLHLKSIIHELLWFLKGDTNIKYLQDNGVRISWPTPDGKHIDQIKKIIDQLKNNPNSRRIIVSAWNVGEIENMALPPCHTFFQFYVCENKLSCQLYQRSADIFLGVPFNIASYALLTLGDAHIYTNHFEQTKLQLSREPKRLPEMIINKDVTNLFDFKYEDFELINYEYHPHIKGKVAI